MGYNTYAAKFQFFKNHLEGLKSLLPKFSRSYPVLAFAMILSFYSCGEITEVDQIEDVSFETSIYHPSFLFSKERNDTLTKTLKFEFNAWAEENSSKVVFGFYDDKDQLIDSKNTHLQLLVNNQSVPTGTIDLDSKILSAGELTLSLAFSPDLPANAFNGYIKVFNSDLDRINNVANLSSSPVLNWSAKQKVIWNPLQKYLVITLATLVAMFLVWLIILRPIVYRRFQRVSLTVQSPFFKKIILKNAISLSLSKSSTNQKGKEKLLVGKRSSYTHPFFSTPILVTPKSKSEAYINLGSNYTIHPYTSVLKKGPNAHTITNSKTKEKITITFS